MSELHSSIPNRLRLSSPFGIGGRRPPRPTENKWKASSILIRSHHKWPAIITVGPIESLCLVGMCVWKREGEGESTLRSHKLPVPFRFIFIYWSHFVMPQGIIMMVHFSWFLMNRIPVPLNSQSKQRARNYVSSGDQVFIFLSFLHLHLCVYYAGPSSHSISSQCFIGRSTRY